MQFFVKFMFSEGDPGLHFYTATHFPTATFLDSNGKSYGQTLNAVRLALLQAWLTTYTGLPSCLRTDKAQLLHLTSGYNLPDLNGIELRLRGVKAHSYLGPGDHLHEPLRKNYLKIRHDYPDLSSCIVLKFSVKAMNDMIRENGLVSTSLVFEVVPRFPVIRRYSPKKRKE